MQSILFLVYILVPLTFGVRNYQNTMIGKYNSGVPKVPNSQNIYELFNNGKKKAKPIIYHKINEDEPLREQENSVEMQNSAVFQPPPAPSMLDSVDFQPPPSFDLRRDNSDTTEPSKLPLYFPIPGGQVGDYNPYPILLRLGPDGNGGIKVDSLSSSKSFEQYFPVPPFAQGREGKNVLLPGRGDYDVPILQPRQYSFPLKKVVREEYNGEMGGDNGYNGGSNGFNGGSNGHNGENNDYNHDMAVFNKIIEELTPPEKSHLSSKNPEQKDLVEKYKRITNTLNGKVVEKDPLEYIRGSHGVEEVISVGYNGGSNGFNGGSNGFNGGSNGFNGGSNGFNGGSNGFNGGSNGFKGGSNGVNGGHNRFEGSNGAKKAVRQGYNIQYTGMKAKNEEYNGGYNGNNGENYVYNEDILGYTNRIKALPPPEKSFGWTSKSLSFRPEQQEIVDKILALLNNGKTV